MKVDNHTTIIKQTPHKQNKLVITAGIGTGWGITSKQPDIFVGITVGYRLK